MNEPLRSFGRLKGRPLSARQQRLIDEALPALGLPDAAPGALSFPGEAWLEIGFGGGEHLIGQARANPGVTLIGVEPFLDGVAKALAGVEDAGLSNVRIVRGDGRDVMAGLADASLTRLFVLFPDPWQKARHNKRRIIQPAFVAEAARLLQPGGEFRLATDWAAYADWMLERVLADGRFAWLAERADDWRHPPPDHVPTRYQEKGLGDCAPVFLRFRRT